MARICPCKATGSRRTGCPAPWWRGRRWCAGRCDGRGFGRGVRRASLPDDLDALVARLEAELHDIRGETVVLERELSSREEQLSEERAGEVRRELERRRGRPNEIEPA